VIVKTRVVGVIAALVMIGCAAPPATTPAETPPAETAAPDTVPGADGGTIAWERGADGVESGYLEVPVDYDDPGRDMMRLFIARRAATDPERRIGSLLINPGGPGFGGADYAAFAPQILDADLLTHFDVVAWDPRGTGLSEPAIDCIDDYDLHFASLDTASDPVAESERLARLFVEGCVDANGDILGHVGTNNSARDIDAIRRALGEDQISYLGFSYGSELGGVWVTLFPDTVRAAVFDGAADPTADSFEASLQQIAGFEATLATFLADCSARPTCRFNNRGDAEGGFDRLLTSLEDAPIPGLPGRPDVGRGIATSAAIMAMYAESFWPLLERALADAAEGDGAGLMSLFDTYYQYQGDGVWGDELEAFQVISCADTADRPSAAELRVRTTRAHQVAPRLVPADAEPGFFCTFFPPAIDPRIDITGAGAGPIVVIGATGDATTPLEGTRSMAAALDGGVLVVLESNNHGAYFTSGCVRAIVADYLIDARVPADGTQCRE